MKRTGHPLYARWLAMIARCSDTSRKDYINYGGRGIKVCDRWKDFDLFCEDIGNPPFTYSCLERKDNDKGYEPSNVVWSDPVEQAKNRRLPEKRTHCYSGHEYNEVNTRIDIRNGREVRFCRVCDREKRRKY